MSDPPRRKRVRVGELLLEQKLINEQQLKTALAEQHRSGRRLGRVLTDLGMVSEQAFHEALAKHLHIPFMDLRQVQLSPDTVRLLPEAQARRSRALVLKADAAGALVAMADPTDLFSYDELAAALKRPIRLALVKEADLLRTMDTVYRRTDEIASIAQEVGQELEADIDIEQLAAEEGSPDAPVIRLIQTMFHDAMQVGASDVHIEPGDSALRVRQRVDGHLQEQVIEGGRRVASALTTRLKLMSGLDIAEKRLPQDGRFSVKVGGKTIDVRLSTMPTQHGESVVMRLLDQSSGLMNLDALGMPPPLLARFRALIERSAGMVLVTGPTGSGKTTTLYSALQHLNQPDTKIITAEDPVEYRLDRINQVQVNAKIGLDFARVLRTTLRQDPDIILVGEMRDSETVEIGLRAAITGHLVFSTLHTMSAVATVHRLLDMGAPGYMIAAAVHGIVAQRLLRRVCEHCAHPAQAGPQEAALLKAQFGAEAAAASFRAGSGCTYCNLTGYRGRIAVYELLEIDRTFTDAILRSDLAGLEEAARTRTDFVSLARSALDLAIRGVTSVSEALGVIGGADTDQASRGVQAADPLLEEALRADALGGGR
ncbi:MAG TPA: GspE/PulE family protein [Steroidobacteraceae bacterium]|nr:GspE/PulE family protein [Steroidobacteraceae bacterium]